jgi:hypothetical protein
MQTIRRVAVGSAFKIGGVLTALIFAIFGLCFVPLWLSAYSFRRGSWTSRRGAAVSS